MIENLLKLCSRTFNKSKSIFPRSQAWKVAMVVIVAIAIVVWITLEVCFISASSIVDYSPIFRNAQHRSKTEKVVIHHTAIDGDSTSILGIYDYHKHTHKWSCGIAYHYLIMNSKVYKLHDNEDQTAHAYGANGNSISICIQADFSKKYVSNREYWEIATMATKMCRKYNLTEDKVVGHCEVEGNCTDCPGSHFDMDMVRLFCKIQRMLI